MADLKVALEDVRDESGPQAVTAPPVSAPARVWKWSALAFAAIAAIGALTFGGWWRTTRTQPEGGPTPFLTRLTSDVGWTDYPAISLDGKFLAYASDRSGDDNLDIWVQQIPDGPPFRLTRHTADEVEPSFSADGSRIAFRSSRLGGGVYIIPTLGGEERLLAARGFSPRFSPDGQLDRVWGRGIGRQPHRSGSSRWRPGYFDRQRLLSGSGTGLVTRRPTSAVLGAAPPRRAAGKQHRLVRDGDSRRVARPDRNARSVTSRKVSGVSGTAVAGCVGPGWKPHSVSRQRRRLLEHVAGGDLSWELADQRSAATRHVWHDGRSGGLGRLRRTDGVHQPNDGSRHLEPANRRQSRKAEGDLKRVTQDAADDYDPSVSEDGTTLVFRSRRGGSIRHHPEEARDERGDRPDQNARRITIRPSAAMERRSRTRIERTARCPSSSSPPPAEPPNRSATTAAKSRPGRRQAIRSCMSRLEIRQAWVS